MTNTSSGSTSDTAREQAAGVAADAKEAGQRVADTAKAEASNVAHEARTQARRLLDQTGGELREQAATQQSRAASGLRSVGDELRSMADSSPDGGVASEVVAQVADRVSGTAQWLEVRDPGSVIEEVKSFARRRPGVFIAIAAGTGFVAARLVKNLVAGTPEGMATNEPAATSGAPTGRMGTDTPTFDSMAASSPIATAGAPAGPR